MSITIALFNNCQIILAMLLVIMVAACFLGRYISLSRKLVIASIGIIGVTLLSNIIANLFFADAIQESDLMLLDTLITVFMFVYAFVFYLLAFKEKRVLRAIESTICLYLFITYISSFTQIAVVYLAGGTEDILVEIFEKYVGAGPLWVTISASGLLITSALFLITYFGFYRQRKYYVISVPYRVLFVIWLVVFTAIPFIPASLPGDVTSLEKRYHMISIFFGISNVILGLAAPVIVLVSSVGRSLREKNKYQESYLSAELEYIKQYKKKQVETRAFRHDIKNNLAMTQMMLEEGRSDEAKTHIASMLGNVSSLSPKYVTGDEMLDIIVSMKADRMDELNIAFTLDGVIDGGLNIKPMEMCSIFANALDNAIEASLSCSEPYVKLLIKRTEKFFVIKIVNSASGKVDVEKLLGSAGYTTKKDKDLHGFGLMNIRVAIEKSNGILKATSEEDKFTLSIMMPRPENM